MVDFRKATVPCFNRYRGLGNYRFIGEVVTVRLYSYLIRLIDRFSRILFDRSFSLLFNPIALNVTLQVTINRLGLNKELRFGFDSWEISGN